MGGEGGPGAAGGCGPASPPPPRDYLVPAAAMSPGRNVPPQIMLFISLGGSAAPLHQAPGGHCARSPVLPSSPCAAAPGLGVAAASAPAQVSESLRAARREGAGCPGASAGELGAQGAGDAMTQRGPGPGCLAWGGRGAQPGRPWRLRQSSPRDAGTRVGFAGAERAGR